MTRIKICCISSLEEARMAIDAGASALGLVGPMPSGPGIIDNDMIHTISRKTPPAISTFLLTSETTAADIINHYQKVHTSTIQIVDAIDPNEYQKIRTALPHVKIVQVIHVIDENSVMEAVELAQYVDAILLDSGNPNLAVKELGGTGRVHNWEWSKSIREKVDVPIFLAGGLNADNVAEAISKVEPYGVDLCSGVRSDGKLDPDKLKAFMNAVRM